MKNPENRTDALNQIKSLLPPLDADRRALAERIHPGVAVRLEDYLEPAISILTPEFPQSVCFREKEYEITALTTVLGYYLKLASDRGTLLEMLDGEILVAGDIQTQDIEFWENFYAIAEGSTLGNIAPKE